MRTQSIAFNSTRETTVGSHPQINSNQPTAVLIYVLLCLFTLFVLVGVFGLLGFIGQRFHRAHLKRKRSHRLIAATRKALKKLALHTLQPSDKEVVSGCDQCAVCIELYRASDIVRILPCRHVFHKKCIDPWLLERRSCPLCKMDILKSCGILLHGFSSSSDLQSDMSNSECTSSASSLAIRHRSTNSHASWSRRFVSMLLGPHHPARQACSAADARRPLNRLPRNHHHNCQHPFVRRCGVHLRDSLSSAEKLSTHSPHSWFSGILHKIKLRYCHRSQRQQFHPTSNSHFCTCRNQHSPLSSHPTINCSVDASYWDSLCDYHASILGVSYSSPPSQVAHRWSYKSPLKAQAHGFRDSTSVVSQSSTPDRSTHQPARKHASRQHFSNWLVVQIKRLVECIVCPPLSSEGRRSMFETYPLNQFPRSGKCDVGFSQCNRRVRVDCASQKQENVVVHETRDANPVVAGATQSAEPLPKASGYTDSAHFVPALHSNSVTCDREILNIPVERLPALPPVVVTHANSGSSSDGSSEPSLVILPPSHIRCVRTNSSIHDSPPLLSSKSICLPGREFTPFASPPCYASRTTTLCPCQPDLEIVSGECTSRPCSYRSTGSCAKCVRPYPFSCAAVSNSSVDRTTDAPQSKLKGVLPSITLSELVPHWRTRECLRQNDWSLIESHRLLIPESKVQRSPPPPYHQVLSDQPGGQITDSVGSKLQIPNIPSCLPVQRAVDSLSCPMCRAERDQSTFALPGSFCDRTHGHHRVDPIYQRSNSAIGHNRSTAFGRKRQRHKIRAERGSRMQPFEMRARVVESTAFVYNDDSSNGAGEHNSQRNLWGVRVIVEPPEVQYHHGPSTSNSTGSSTDTWEAKPLSSCTVHVNSDLNGFDSSVEVASQSQPVVT